MIPPSVFHKRSRSKGTLSELNTADYIFYTKHHLDGTKETKFHVNLIDLLDRVFLEDALRYLSIDQERFIEKFCKQADSVTKLINSDSDNPYKNMDDVFKQLDSFLGGYLGEDNGHYSR